MRTIADSTGLEWSVFEVKRQNTTDERRSHLPDEFVNGWLCFESDFGKRRLTPVPPRWEEYGDDELARMLLEAQPAIRLRPDADERRRAY